MQFQVDCTGLFTSELCCVAVVRGMLRRFRRNNNNNNNNNNPICKAPECQKTSVALGYGKTPQRNAFCMNER